MSTVVGLDIGGANLKAADSQGQSVARPFSLWKYPDQLGQALVDLVAPFQPVTGLAVTMTGELCDCYLSKRQGVKAILDTVSASFPSAEIQVWSTKGCFLNVTEAKNNALSVAAANWHGLATWAGRFVRQGVALLVDVGSTTTDLIPLRDGVPVPKGLTDPERLRSGELIYTGMQRTPVCAVESQSLAAEFFATMQDVYVILEMLPEQGEESSTADGLPMTRENAHRRLARMLCADLETSTEDERLALARQLKDRQIELLSRGIERVVTQTIERLSVSPERVIVSGSGEPLARLALEQCKPVRRIKQSCARSLSAESGLKIASASCAYAIAVLAFEASLD